MTVDEKKTILIVDDDEDFRFQQKVQLEAAGYAVVEADSTDAALALVDACEAGAPFQAAVVDLMMEEMDAGFALCYQLKNRLPEMPVILVTGVTRETGMEFETATSEERSWIKADAVLAKPIRFDQLQRELNRLVKG